MAERQKLFKHAQVRHLEQTDLKPLLQGTALKSQPLEPTLRSTPEPRFGHSFENIRVYADEPTAQVTDNFNASAGSSRLFSSLTGGEASAFAGIQTKLTIGAPDDHHEQEADRVARQVMNAPGSATSQSDQEQSEPEGTQQSTASASKPDSSTGGSSPLPGGVQDYMEERFGADFSHVHVHTDSDAALMNQALQAQAFTYGNHIYYGSGKTPGMDELTAHELTHVVQQSGAGSASSKQMQQASTESHPSKSSEANIGSFAPLSVQRSVWTGDNLKDDFWGTKQLLGSKWGGVADAGISSAWDLAGVIPGVGTASGLVGAGIDGVKSLASSGMAAYHTSNGNLDAADQDAAASSRFAKDIAVDAASAIPIWGTGQSATSLLWDGASAIDRGTGGKTAPLSGDIFAEELWK